MANVLLIACNVLNLTYYFVDQCISYPCVIFEDEFDKLDMQKWQHELTASGEGVSRCIRVRHPLTTKQNQ